MIHLIFLFLKQHAGFLTSCVFFSFQIYNHLEVLARYQVYVVESVTQEIYSQLRLYINITVMLGLWVLLLG